MSRARLPAPLAALASFGRRGLPPLLLALTLVLGCDSPVDTPSPGGVLELRVDLPTGSVIDAGVVRIRGDATRNVTINPGETKEIDLDPGTYSVALEGLMAGAVATFGERDGVVVREGEFTTVTLNMADFVPRFTTVPDQVQAGQDFTITWSPVSGAVSYDLVVADEPDFSAGSVIRSESASTSSLTLSLAEGGDHYFRVRARNEFNSLGAFSEVSGGIMVLVAPLVTENTHEFFPATLESCPAEFQAFAMTQTIEYSMPAGDFPTNGPINENGGRIESQLRDQGETTWTPVISTGRSWRVRSGASGSSGTLDSDICFSGREEADVIEFRTRVISSDGDEGPWSQTELWLPKTVEASERVDLGFGESVQLDAVARDVNDEVVPGDPITWSQFNTGVGLVGPDGVYTVHEAPGPGGLDQVYARAGHAWDNVPIQGPEAGRFRSWWAPCWSFDNPALRLPADTFRPFRLRAFPGQEYLIELEDPTDGTTPSGDADLYVRAHEPPTRDEYDQRSASLAHEESITVLADSEHTLWFAVDAWTDIENIRLEVTTTDGRCGFPGTGIDPAAVSGSAPARVEAPLSAGRRAEAPATSRPSSARDTRPSPDGLSPRAASTIDVTSVGGGR